MSTNQTNKQSKDEPVSEILSEINLAATAIADLGALIARRFGEVNSQLPYARRTLDLIPPPADANDQLFPVSRIALRWGCRTQAAYERLVKADARLVYFGRVGYLRLSDLLAIEQELSAPLRPFPSRQKRAKANPEP